MTTWDYVYVRHAGSLCAVFPSGLVSAAIKQDLPQAKKICVQLSEDWLEFAEASDCRKAYRAITRRLLEDGWEPFSATMSELHLRRIAPPQ